MKHCKSKLKFVYIIPVRIKKRKVKKEVIFDKPPRKSPENFAYSK
nr:MAG TPA: hypothetical protein [Microviridae sp.]